MVDQFDSMSLGTILGVWAHPDDEAFTSAGIMKLAIEKGQKVIIVTATKGDAGQTADEDRWPQSKLAAIREQEQRRCLTCIGDVELIWLDYADGKLAEIDSSDAINRIAELIDGQAVDTVLTFGEDGITGHDDHKTVSLWAVKAARKSMRKPRVFGAQVSCDDPQEITQMMEYDRRFNLFFNTDKPRIIKSSEAALYLAVYDRKELMNCKLRCLRAHASQTAHLFAQDDAEELLAGIAGVEAFIELT